MDTKERMILRKIFGPLKEIREYRTRHNHGPYTCVKKVVNSTTKTRITCYSYMTRVSVNTDRWPTRIFAYIVNKKSKGW